ncbi:histidine phosphatase family protein [Pedobacter gandavensis]|uniref:histidine phosphatase family protein n=1 Tax=Pedobacter gandavensis TaxID=2679963 RepID=UPI00292DEC68|nr:histidine phosphatase family protein [Pedobacter gandavensis]
MIKMKRLLFLFLLLVASYGLQAQTTKIWIVRHGEKNLENPEDKDPPLSSAGETRAIELAKYLKGNKMAALFSTDYKRTRGTLAPLAAAQHLPLQLYKSTAYKALADTILNNYKGKNIVICGHSNRLLGIISAFNGSSTLKEITEDEYSHIFLIEIKGDRVKLKEGHYGKL